MDYEKDILIFSGEGIRGTWERYFGARTQKALRNKLSRERSGGDRWASAWIDLGNGTYGQLGGDLETIEDQRDVPESEIVENPAAKLRAGKSNPASRENGRLGGRPRKA